MNFDAIVVAFAFMVCVMAVAWGVQRLTGNVGWVDVCWTYGTGVMGVGLALWPFGGITGTQALVACLVAIWSIRLGTHVAVRVRFSSEDTRYRALREEWGARFQWRLFSFLEIQAVVSAVIGAAIMAAAHRETPLMSLTNLLGGMILIVGIVGEAVADRQLSRFKRDKARSGTICKIGLWSWSRHPNYFFEWVCWLAYPVIAWGGSGFWWALGAPVIMYAVLVYGSGVPPVERQMALSRGVEFDRYKARTSVFFPLPPKS